MPSHSVNLLFRLRQTLQAVAGAVPDAELLARYADGGDQAAFELLLWRHGPMVWGVCRRVLGHTQDAEDAFQAAFIALARRASSLRSGSTLAGWLYRVAHRAALAARHRRAAAAITPALPALVSADDPVRRAADRELADLLDAEIERLPERVRLPFILCVLQGRSRAEAAAELCCPVGTVESRLHRARGLLRSRLTRRGVGLPATLLAVGIPATLRAATLQHIVAPAATSLPATLLAEHVLRSLAVGTLKKCAAAVLAVCALVTGAGIAALRPSSAPAAPGSPAAPLVPPRPVARPAPQALPLPAEAVARVGSPRLRHGKSVDAIAFSPDGKWIASAGRDGVVRIWETGTGRQHRSISFKGGPWPLFRLAFTAAGKSLVVLDNHSCRIVDVQTGKEQVSHPHPFGEAANVAALAFDGSLFATGQPEKEITVHDTLTGKQRHALSIKGNWNRSAAFAADGRTIAVCSSREIKGEPGELQVFDAVTGKSQLEVSDGTRRLGAPALSPDGKTLAALSSADADGEVLVLWDVRSSKVVRRIKGLERTASCLSFSPDGKLVAVGNVQRLWLQLFDVATGTEVRRLRCWPSVTMIAFSTDGKTLAAAKSEGMVSLWDVTTGKPHPASPDPDGCLGELRFTDGGRALLTVAGNIAVRDYRTNRSTRRLADLRKNMFLGLAVSRDEKLIAVCDPDSGVRLVDAQTGKDVRTLKGHRVPADQALFAPDGRRLFTLAYDQTVHVWDVATGKTLHILEVAAVNSGSRLAVSPDGKVLAALGPSGPGGPSEIRLWDVQHGTELRRLAVMAFGWDLAFSPDGSQIACVGQPLENGRLGDISGVVLLWDVATGRQLRSFAGHSGAVYGVSFSPNGRMLATAGHDHTVRLWEVATGKERHRFTGHASPVSRVAFSPDGRFVASTSAEAPVFVWDVAGTGQRLAPGAWTVAERDRLWQELGGADADAAFKAMRQLHARPAESVALLRERLQPVLAPDEERVRQLLRDLDSDSFAKRENAEAELKKLVADVEGLLRRERAQTPSREVQRRLDRLLKNPPVRLRSERALEVLELLATPEAKALLERLSQGGAGARLTMEAAAARQRIRRMAP